MMGLETVNCDGSKTNNYDQKCKKFNSTKTDKFASILQTSLSQFTTSLGQLLINQSSKRPTEEDHRLQENQQKGFKLTLNAQKMNLHVLNTWTGL